MSEKPSIISWKMSFVDESYEIDKTREIYKWNRLNIVDLKQGGDAD